MAAVGRFDLLVSAVRLLAVAVTFAAVGQTTGFLAGASFAAVG